MHRNRSVQNHAFSMIPRADIPRSTFKTESAHKTTFEGGYLVPFYLDEILPGDSFNVKSTIFARLATPIAPIMDNMHLETFWFFVPNRLVWDNWQKFQGEQKNPGDSISYVVPQVTSPAGGYAVGSLQDYMGLPTTGQLLGGNTYTHSTLFNRAYNLIYNEWFRDQNLQNSAVVDLDDGPDTPTDYVLRRRGKRHDYFTSCLPWPQKGTAVTLPLGTTAPIVSTGVSINMRGGTGALTGLNLPAAAGNVVTNGPTTAGTANWGAAGYVMPSLQADLSTATAATINQIRQAFQIQRLLERDARGGTRYTEIILSHFGVRSPDARLQRPEYLGGGTTPVNINPIAQTSGTTVTGSDTPQGNLAAMGTALASNHGFSQSFTEHGMLIGLMSVRADLTYQQGVRKMWDRRTRYDFYMPVFAHLGEQAVLNREIYADGSANDTAVFGYQERWAEYRYNPSMITGLFRSTAAGTLDYWHLAQDFATLPALNNTFIQDDPPIDRIIAVPTEPHFIMDSMTVARKTRLMPMYSVPGFIDRF